jgi:hypothetical protein
MAGLFQKALYLLTSSDSGQMIRRAPQSSKSTRQQLLEREGEIGGHLFGPIPMGRKRKFFNLDPKTWVWSEEWIDGKGKRQTLTARYKVYQDGILKELDGQPYYYLDGQELKNFLAATKLYYNRVARDIYHRDPGTGKPLAV